MSESDEEQKRNEGRSPPFPFIHIGRAIEQARKLERSCKGHWVRVATAIEAFGYKGESSGGRQTVAALKAYGLLADAGSKTDRKVQLTDFAKRLLLPPPEPMAKEMIREAALKPRLIKALWDRWGAERPPTTECNFTLVDEFHFTRAAAALFLGVYDATVSYADLDRSDRVSGLEDGLGADLPSDLVLDAQSAPQGSARVEQPQAETDLEVQEMEGERELEKGLLSKDAAFRLIVRGDVGPAEIDRLIRRLQLTKEILADQTDKPTHDQEPQLPFAIAAE